MSRRAEAVRWVGDDPGVLRISPLHHDLGTTTHHETDKIKHTQHLGLA
jgi:hypothetical protein